MKNSSSYRPLSTSASASLVAIAMTSAMLSIEEFTRSLPSVDLFDSFKPLGAADTKVKDILLSLSATYEAATPFEISDAARLAIGSDGVQRLERFRALLENWDHEGALPLDPKSVIAFSQFFRDTNIQPSGLAIFMSRDGNVTVNWVDEQDLVTELEFLGDQVHYFFEESGQEGLATQYEMAYMLGGIRYQLAA